MILWASLTAKTSGEVCCDRMSNWLQGECTWRRGGRSPRPLILDHPAGGRTLHRDGPRSGGAPSRPLCQSFVGSRPNAARRCISSQPCQSCLLQPGLPPARCLHVPKYVSPPAVCFRAWQQLVAAYSHCSAIAIPSSSRCLRFLTKPSCYPALAFPAWHSPGPTATAAAGATAARVGFDASPALCPGLFGGNLGHTQQFQIPVLPHLASLA